MSQGSVEIVRFALEAIGGGDIDSAFKDLAPDAEYGSVRTPSSRLQPAA
jgi:hypothetical protein